jgi:hypothetical protein
VAELWGEDTLRAIEIARQRVRRLRELTGTFLPRSESSTGRHGDWPLTGFAMLARACGSAESVIALAGQRRAVDAGALSRTLFEQVVTFAWIAIDPAHNTDAWVRWDRQQRIKADNDFVAHGLPPLLEPAIRQEFQAVIASGPVMPDNLTQRASQADAHWAARVDAIDADPASERSFRGMYRVIYRTDSQFTHAAVMSVEPFVIPSAEPPAWYALAVESDPGQVNPFTRAPVLYALGLLVAEPALGLSGMECAIERIFSL